MKVPSPGESITEVKIAEWLVQDNNYVEKGQAIADVDSDKATLELPAEASGIIKLEDANGHRYEEGDAVTVGAVVCLIDTSAKKPEGSEQSLVSSKETKKGTPVTSSAVEKSQPKGATYATGTPSPKVKKILDEKGIEPTAISSIGKDGRITKDDAVKAVPSIGTPSGGNRGSSRSKMSMLRRKVAKRLVKAKNTTAMLTTFNEVDMSPIFELREQYKEDFKAKHGVSLGFMSFFTLDVVRALKLSCRKLYDRW